MNAVLDQLDSIIKNASMDVYSGTEDDILRKLEVNVDLGTPQGDAVTMDLSLSLSAVNEPQEITGPADAQPLSALLKQLNIDPGQLGQLGAVLGGASAAPQAGLAAPTGGASQAYLECLQTAETSDALQQCARRCSSRRRGAWSPAWWRPASRARAARRDPTARA